MLQDMQSFIASHVKAKSDLSMAELVRKLGMTKPSFYRRTAEPFRFKNEELEAIAEILELNEENRRALFSYKNGNAKSEKKDEEDEDAYIYFDDLMRGGRKLRIQSSARIFSLYSQGEENRDIHKRSASELIGILREQLEIKDNRAEKKSSFEVLICNSYSDHIASAVCSLFKEIANFKELTDQRNFSVKHFINTSNGDNDVALRSLSNLYQITFYARYAFYSVYYEDLSNVLHGAADWCLARYTDSKNTERFLWINFANSSDIQMYAFTDRNLFDYLLDQYRILENELAPTAMPPLTSFEISNYVIKATKNYSKVLYSPDICFDNIPPEIWPGIVRRYFIDATEEERKEMWERIVRYTGAANHNVAFGDPIQAVSDLVEGFCVRYRVSEECETKTILAPRTLLEMSECNTTYELKPLEIKFTDDEVIMLLRNILERIGTGNTNKRQSYYLMNRRIETINSAMLIFENYEIGIYFHEDDFSSIYWTILKQPEMAGKFYNYFTNHLIADEERGSYDSLLMNDSDARIFIQGLINKVESRRIKD